VTDEATDPADGSAVAGRAVLSPDVSARDWTRTRTSDATAPPPPPPEAAAEAVRVEAAQAGAEDDERDDERTVSIRLADLPPEVTGHLGEPVRATAPARRPPLLVQGLGSALVGGVLAGLAAWGAVPLAVAVLLLQVVLVLALLALLAAPAAGGALLVGLSAAVAADALVLADDGRIDRLAGVVGLSLVAALLHQLLRRGRNRVTESLADTLVGVVVAVSAACLVALADGDGDRGEHVLLVGLAAAAVALLVGRVVDRLLPRPALATGATRGWPGLLLGLACGTVAALLVAPLDDADVLTLPSAALLGLLVAATVATADLAVDLGAAELRAGWRDARRVSALRPAALLLPYAVLGPVALLAGRLVLG
jgi:hypothetical protein